MACTVDTESIALTVAAGNLSGDVILDPDPANAASIGPSGLMVSGANETSWFAADETWTYAASDAPVFTFTIIGDKTTKYYPGMRVKLAQTSTKYFIIVAATYDGGTGLTTIAVFGGTDYTLVSALITTPQYSVAKVPTGFNASPSKWTVELVDTADRSQAAPSAGTWYNLGSLALTIPIGSWDVYWECVTRSIYSASSQIDARTTLATANNSETDQELSHAIEIGNSANSATRVTGAFHRRKTIDLAAKTQYFLNARASGSCTSIVFMGGTYAATVIRAVCGFL